MRLYTRRLWSCCYWFSSMRGRWNKFFVCNKQEKSLWILRQSVIFVGCKMLYLSINITECTPNTTHSIYIQKLPATRYHHIIMFRFAHRTRRRFLSLVGYIGVTYGICWCVIKFDNPPVTCSWWEELRAIRTVKTLPQKLSTPIRNTTS